MCVCMYRFVFFFLLLYFFQLFSFWCFSVFLGIFELFVGLQLRPFALGEHARPSLGASASSLFLSVSVCVVLWSLLLRSTLSFFFCSLLKSLFDCLASTCLGKTVTPTVGRDSPPAKPPLKP